MNKRFVLPLLVAVLTIPIVAACGGGGAASPEVSQPVAIKTVSLITPAATAPVTTTAQASETAAATTPVASATEPTAIAPTAAPANSAVATQPAATLPTPVATTAAAPTPTPVPPPAQFTIVMLDGRFSTTLLSVQANQRTTIVQRNDGKEIHNWALCLTPDCSGFVAEGDLLAAGKQSQVQFVLNQPGTYKFECEVHTETMVGTVVVS